MPQRFGSQHLDAQHHGSQGSTNETNRRACLLPSQNARTIDPRPSAFLEQQGRFSGAPQPQQATPVGVFLSLESS
jgi:hypothetical protein